MGTVSTASRLLVCGLLAMVSVCVLTCAGEEHGCYDCPAGLTCCGSVCVSLWDSEANCGRCGEACPVGQSCSEGECRDLEACRRIGLTACPPFEECIDTTVDPEHCGGCGVQCGEIQRCVGGECRLADCPYEWLDLARDPDNCGRCRLRCPTGSECLGGTCVCSDGNTLCDGRCVDAGADVEHCGGCNRRCPPGAICDDGRCACPAGTTQCGDGCRDLSRDHESCGACSHACSLDAQCLDGRCACPDGLTTCDGRYCADVATDDLDCGECGRACNSGHECVGGECAPLFDVACVRVCDGVCVASNDDFSHCDACGLAVPSGATCDDGRIACPRGTVDCDSSFVALDCRPAPPRGYQCTDCNDGLGCIGGRCEGNECVASPLPARLELTCGGPHRAGDSPMLCRAFVSTSSRRTEVGTSPFLRWTRGRCEGPTCRPSSGPDAPGLIEGHGGFDDDGTFIPAGQADPSAVTSDVLLHVRARFQLGSVDLEQSIAVRTVPE